LSVSLTLLAIALGLALSRSPQEVATANSSGALTKLIYGVAGRLCRANELLPRGTTAIRFATEGLVGPRLTLTAATDERVISTGALEAGWSGKTATVPIEPLDRTVSHVTLCLTVPTAYTVQKIVGVKAPASQATDWDGRALAIRMRTEFLKPAHDSWWSLASAIARRMALGHAWSGLWIVPFLVAAMLTSLFVGSRLILRELK
jgi:hypothetical protein